MRVARFGKAMDDTRIEFCFNRIVVLVQLGNALLNLLLHPKCLRLWLHATRDEFHELKLNDCLIFWEAKTHVLQIRKLACRSEPVKAFLQLGGPLLQAAPWQRPSRENVRK